MTAGRVVPSRADVVTADAFLNDEASSEASEPREIFELSYGTTTFRMASGTRDLQVGIFSYIYTAEPIARSAFKVVQVRDGSDQVLDFTIRIDHPFVQRWLQMGIPPKTARLVAKRLQLRSGLVEQFWSGSVVGLSCDRDGAAHLTVSSLLGVPLRRRLPTITAGRQCSHVLYDEGCRLDRNAFKITTPAIFVDGRTVLVDMGAGHGVDWAAFGQLVHVASGERMSIQEQRDMGGGSTQAYLDLHMPIVGLAFGQTVEVYAGCAHDIATCSSPKFANQLNYGGFPEMPTKNPFLSTGYGVMEQT